MVQVLQSGGQRDTLAGSTPVQHVFTFWKGRVALYGTLKALGIGPGDSVIVPGYTCAAVPGAVKFVGASSVYADIDPESYSPSLGTYSDAFEAHAHARVKALILQHTYGIPADVPRIAAWAREQGMALIEDCAHAIRDALPSRGWLLAGSRKRGRRRVLQFAVVEAGFHRFRRLVSDFRPQARRTAGSFS